MKKIWLVFLVLGAAFAVRSLLVDERKDDTSVRKQVPSDVRLHGVAVRAHTSATTSLYHASPTHNSRVPSERGSARSLPLGAAAHAQGRPHGDAPAARLQVDVEAKRAPESQATEREARSRHELQQRWESEHQDKVWTDDTAEYVLDVLATLKIPQSRLESVDCRSTICQLRMKFASQAEAANAAGLQHPDHQMRFFADGMLHDVYIGRAGQPLEPEVQQESPAFDAASERADESGELEHSAPTGRDIPPLSKLSLDQPSRDEGRHQPGALDVGPADLASPPSVGRQSSAD